MFRMSFFTCFVHVQLFLVCHVRAGFIIMMHEIWFYSIHFIFDVICFSSCNVSKIHSKPIEHAQYRLIFNNLDFHWISGDFEMEFNFVMDRWTNFNLVHCIQQQTKIDKNIFKIQYPFQKLHTDVGQSSRWQNRTKPFTPQIFTVDIPFYILMCGMVCLKVFGKYWSKILQCICINKSTIFVHHRRLVHTETF